MPHHAPPANLDPMVPLDQLVRAARSSTAPVVAGLQRRACYGSCPVYQLAIYSDGTVSFYGELWVPRVGPMSWSIPPPDVEKLLAELRKVGAFDLPKDAYDTYEWTDMASASIYFRDANKERRIEHYFGDTKAPDAVCSAEALIDQYAQVKVYVTDSAEPELPTGRLVLTSRELLRVYEGRAELGVLPVQLELPVGQHTLTLVDANDPKRSFALDVEIHADKQLKLHVDTSKLKPAPAPAPTQPAR